jgi:hypothetical protein
VLTVVRTLGEDAILRRVVRPSKLRFRHPSNRSVKVGRLTRIEIFPVMEEVPDDGAYESGLGLFEVDVGELVAGVGDKDGSEDVLNILEIRSSSELTKTRTEASSIGSCDVKACSHTSVRVNVSSEDTFLFCDVPKE